MSSLWVNNALLVSKQSSACEWTMFSLWVNNIQFISEQCSVCEWTIFSNLQLVSEQCPAYEWSVFSLWMNKILIFSSQLIFQSFSYSCKFLIFCRVFFGFQFDINWWKFKYFALMNSRKCRYFPFSYFHLVLIFGFQFDVNLSNLVCFLSY